MEGIDGGAGVPEAREATRATEAPPGRTLPTTMSPMKTRGGDRGRQEPERRRCIRIYIFGAGVFEGVFLP